MGEKLQLLFVGTEQDAAIIRQLLKASSYQGSRTYYAPDVTTVALNRRYDAIITDLAGGIETVLALKQLYPDTPLLYFGTNERLAMRAIALGVQDFLPKQETDSSSLVRSILFAQDREEITGQLKENSFTDDLTGLYNRRGFITLARNQLEQAYRSNQGLILFLFDIDFFKQINDQYGHLVGDDALIQTALCLKKAFRSYDIIGRIGGDEFAVLALNACSENADNLKRHLWTRLRALNQTKKPYSISCSIGFAALNGSRDSLEQLLARADRELYRDKRQRHLLLGRDERI